METASRKTVNEARHRGPNLGAVGVIYTSLFLASLIVPAIMTKGGHIPSPFASPDLAQAFFYGHADAVRIGAFLQFGAAIPLGIFTATAVSRLQFLGMNVAGAFIPFFASIPPSSLTAISPAVP